MPEPLIVIGHKSPDTDSTCSAIAYAWFLREHKGLDAVARVAGTPNKEAAYVLEHFGIETPPILEAFPAGVEAVIVDTNNPEELLPGWEQAQIQEIIDHHKLVGGITTAEPIAVTVRPVGCTATVILGLMKEDGVNEIPKEIASLLLASILSDTLKFTSPTTTNLDQEVAEGLAAAAGISIDELAEGMFTAKSDLTGLSVRDLLTADSKVFTLGGKKVRISVLETTNPAPALARRGELEAGMDALKQEEGIDGALCFVVDIVKSEAVLVAPVGWERELAAKAFKRQFDDELMLLPGVVSRKKQIVPALEDAA